MSELERETAVSHVEGAGSALQLVKWSPRLIVMQKMHVRLTATVVQHLLLLALLVLLAVLTVVLVVPVAGRWAQAMLGMRLRASGAW